MEIEVKKVTIEQLKKYNLQEVLLGYRTGIFSNMDIITAYSNDHVNLGFAVVTPSKNVMTDKVFKANLGHIALYDSDDCDNLYSEFIPILRKCSYLNYIRSYSKEKNTGRFILNHIKKLYKSIWLYSVIDAEDFYIKNGFKEICPEEHSFIFTK